MNTGHKGLIKEMKDLSNSIIQEKCNIKQPEYEVTISDFSNWLIDSFDSHFDKQQIKNILFSKGYEVCKKREANHYAFLSKKGTEQSKFNLWLKLIV